MAKEKEKLSLTDYDAYDEPVENAKLDTTADTTSQDDDSAKSSTESESPAERLSEPTEDTPISLSARDQFRQRVKEDYPDLDVDDDDAYYANANERYDRLKAYDASTQNFRDALNLDSEKAGTFNEMIVAASEHPDFDPVLWMVENAGLDVESMLGDPEYSQKLGEARAKYLEQISEGEELSRQFEENAPKSMEELNAWCEENDVDNETKRSVIEKMYSLMDDLMVGKLPLDFFDLCYKGMTHDDDVDMAKEAGKAEGRSQKVSEKLRKVGGIPRIGGRQSSVSDAPSLDQNMFGL